MADENNDQNNQNSETNTQQTSSSSTTVDVAKLVAEKVAEELKDIKSKLDKAYSLRDEALSKVAEFERIKKEEEIKRLQEEGKHKEVYELQLAELQGKLKDLENANISLSRDAQVREAIAGLEFRNDKAMAVAIREITGELVRNEHGAWVHKSGVSIRDYVDLFSKDDNQSFLFKPKVSSGGGSSAPSSSNNGGTAKSLFEMSQEDVLKLAEQGKLPRR